MTRSLLVAGVVAGVLLTGCGRDESSPSGARWARTVAGLCAAGQQARDGDIEGAESTFFDQSHDALHELADEATDDDRSAAADLLRAKEAVESDFTSSSPSAADDLDSLVTATRAAIRSTGATAPSGCRS
jgi:hypothetical protein